MKIVYCDLCDPSDCEHIDYALTQPDIQKELKTRLGKKTPEKDEE